MCVTVNKVSHKNPTKGFFGVYYKSKHEFFKFMPVKSTSASSVKSTTTRKRRTRKTSQTAAKSVAKVTPTLKTVSVKNVGQSPAKVTPTPKTVSVKKAVKSPAKKVSTRKLKRPAKTVLTLNHYVRDYQSRVKIHNYEFNLFLEDCKKGLQLADKSLRSFYNYALQSYKVHFNV